MKSYISSIVLINSTDDKRVVPLKAGVNIITGDSKTGKSSLVEIIDYCLCSSRSTIPKGEITKFAVLFCITLVINNDCYVIARQAVDLGGKMYISKQPESFNPDKLNLSYFDNLPLQAPKEIQEQIETALGLSVTNMQTENLDGKPEKASLRNIVSFLFQHQNLMASKFALFYRFNDFYKRKAVIQQFPVFAGLVGQDYYSKIIRLNELKNQVKKLKKNAETNKTAKEKIKAALSPLLQDYFALLNLSFNKEISLSEMLETANNLPALDDSPLFNDSGIMERYHELSGQLASLRDTEHELSIQINDISTANNTGTGFIEALNELKERTTLGIPDETTGYTCPLCGNSCEEINYIDSEILDASEWLESEIAITQKYTNDFSEEIRKLSSKKDDITNQIKNIWRRMKDIENNYINSKELLTKKEQIEYAKVKIHLYAEMTSSGVFKNAEVDLEDLQSKIDSLQSQIDGFDLDTEMRKAEAFISKNMNQLAEKLDFEDEYRPVNLNFGLSNETYDLYHHQKQRDKIFLYEMGSGANWVSCHIALFLSILRYFAKNPKAPMLLTMFFDQPSQVYFPHAVDKNSADIIAVENMYQTIFDEINSIERAYKILPQIIIVDHVSGFDLKNKNEFLSYVRRDWRNKKGLV